MNPGTYGRLELQFLDPASGTLVAPEPARYSDIIPWPLNKRLIRSQRMLKVWCGDCLGSRRRVLPLRWGSISAQASGV